MTDETTMRRVPRQARSQQRVNLLLDTAARVFAEVGFEAATTNAIAARAGVPIGSLYQFFPSKEAILDALVGRYAAEMGAVLSDEQLDKLSLDEAISRLIDGLAMFEATHTGFKTIFAQTNTTHRMHAEIASRVEAMMARRFPKLDVARRREGAIVAVGIVKGLLSLSEAPDSLPPERLLVEIKTALVAYLRALLAREGSE